MADSIVLSLSGLNKTYGKGENEVHALKDVNLQIKSKEMIAIVGASGSGKSTLLNIIGLLDIKTSGSYNLLNNNIDKLNEKKKANLRNSIFGFVVQDFALVEKYTVKQNVEIPLSYRPKKLSDTDKKHAIISSLEKMGIASKINALASNLSGGQRQRVAIARALVNNPQIILADEPTGALDIETTEEMMQVFKQLNQEGKAVIIITHNPVVAGYCDRTLIMSDGQLSEKQPF